MDKKHNFMRPRVEKDFEKFVYLLPKLEPIEFFGLAKFFGVALGTDEKDENGRAKDRPMDLILEDMMNRFETLSKRRRKEVLEAMSEVARGRS